MLALAFRDHERLFFILCAAFFLIVFMTDCAVVRPPFSNFYDFVLLAFLCVPFVLCVVLWLYFDRCSFAGSTRFLYVWLFFGLYVFAFFPCLDWPLFSFFFFFFSYWTCL